MASLSFHFVVKRAQKQHDSGHPAISGDRKSPLKTHRWHARAAYAARLVRSVGKMAGGLVHGGKDTALQIVSDRMNAGGQTPSRLRQARFASEITDSERR